MPGGKIAFPKLSATRNRQYEHIKASELRSGKSLKKAKAMAAGGMYNSIKGRRRV